MVSASENPQGHEGVDPPSKGANSAGKFPLDGQPTKSPEIRGQKRKASPERQVPPKFRQRLRERVDNREIDENIEEYYLNMHRGDSRSVQVKGGRYSSLEKTLIRDAWVRLNGDRKRKGPNWMPTKSLGAGSFGNVVLWEQHRPDGQTLQLAIKEAMKPDQDYLDYNKEGNLIRRLNDRGVKNVITVLDWVLIGDSEDKFRTCLEYGEFDNLHEMTEFYFMHRLVLPEAFIWYIFYCMADALCYCQYGTNNPTDGKPERGWAEILHRDVKDSNIFLTVPDKKTHGLYPCPKLGDFGSSELIDHPEIKARLDHAGTITYDAPEARAKSTVGIKTSLDPSRSQGSHTDIYSLGVVIARLCECVNQHLTSRSRREFAGYSRYHIVSDYYTPGLLSLIRKCRSRQPGDRPTTLALLAETKHQMETYRKKAYRAEKQSHTKRFPGYLFHEKVLYTDADKRLFTENVTFRGLYQEVNLGPVREKEAKYYGRELAPWPTEDSSILTDQRTSQGGVSDEEEEDVEDNGTDSNSNSSSSSDGANQPQPQPAQPQPQPQPQPAQPQPQPQPSSPSANIRSAIHKGFNFFIRRDAD